MEAGIEQEIQAMAETQTEEKTQTESEKQAEAETQTESKAQTASELQNVKEQSAQLMDIICQGLFLDKITAQTQSPLVLAYIGDAVYELVVRTKVISHAEATVSKLHHRSSQLVKAQTQAASVKLLSLTQEEERIFKRGRNAKSYTMAKNATMADYRAATGFEALIGYLYLDGQTERMLQLIHEGIDAYIKHKVTIHS